MTAFLEKLRKICISCPEELGGWSEQGNAFEVRSVKFNALLKNYYKGTVKTFIRQLHFYGFSKSESVNGKWTFAHPKLNRRNPDTILEITRKTRMNTVAFTPREDFDNLRKQVSRLQETVCRDIGQIKTHMDDLWKAINALKQNPQIPPMLDSEREQYLHFPDLELRRGSEFRYPQENTLKNTDIDMQAKKKVKLSPSVCSLGSSEDTTDPVLDFMMKGFALPVRDCDVDLIRTSSLFQD